LGKERVSGRGFRINGIKIRIDPENTVLQEMTFTETVVGKLLKDGEKNMLKKGGSRAKGTMTLGISGKKCEVTFILKTITDICNMNQSSFRDCVSLAFISFNLK
jgi:hypothetical protein